MTQVRVGHTSAFMKNGLLLMVPWLSREVSQDVAWGRALGRFRCVPAVWSLGWAWLLESRDSRESARLGHLRFWATKSAFQGIATSPVAASPNADTCHAHGERKRRSAQHEIRSEVSSSASLSPCLPLSVFLRLSLSHLSPLFLSLSEISFLSSSHLSLISLALCSHGFLVPFLSHSRLSL